MRRFLTLLNEDPCLVGDTCNSTKTTQDCITCWGPERGYPPIPDSNVEAQCFTTPVASGGLGCCVDTTGQSPTGYTDCPPPPLPVWDGCGGQTNSTYNSTAYCEYVAPQNVTGCFESEGCCPGSSLTGWVVCPPTPVWNGCDNKAGVPSNATVVANSTAYCEQQKSVTVSECFEAKGCCPGDSSTNWVYCPPELPYKLPDYAVFFIAESAALLLVGAGTALAYRKGALGAAKAWGLIGFSVGGWLGAGMAWGVKGSAGATIGPVAGVLGASALAGYLMYKKMSPAGGPAAQPLLQIQVAGSNCCTFC